MGFLSTPAGALSSTVDRMSKVLKNAISLCALLPLFFFQCFCRKGTEFDNFVKTLAQILRAVSVCV